MFSDSGFDALIENRAVDAIHTDIETSGGLLETKGIADYAELAGIQVATHHAGSPVGAFPVTIAPPLSVATSWPWRTTHSTCPGGKTW